MRGPNDRPHPRPRAPPARTTRSSRSSRAGCAGGWWGRRRRSFHPTVSSLVAGVRPGPPGPGATAGRTGRGRGQLAAPRRRSTQGRRPRVDQPPGSRATRRRPASACQTRRRPASARQTRGRRRARGRSSRPSRTGPRPEHSRTSRGTLARSPSMDRWLRSKGAGTRSPKERRPRRSSPTLVPMPGASADRAPNPTRPPSPAPTSTLNLPLRVRRALWQLREWTWGEQRRRRDRATVAPRLARGPVGYRTRPRTRPRRRGTSRSFASRRPGQPPTQRTSATQRGTASPST